MSTITEVTAHYKQQLLHQEAHAQAVLQSQYAHTLSVITPQLNSLIHQIAQMQAAGQPIPPSWLYERNRLQTLKALIQGHINQFGAMSRMQVGQLQHQAIALGMQAGHQQLQASVPPGVSYSFGVPSQDAIASMVGATQSGSPLADLFAGFGEEAADGAGKALVTGVMTGQNPRQITTQVMQALGVSRARALVICRSEMIRSYRSANLSIFQANDDVVDSWIWQANLGKSCAACTAMNGTEHPLSEDMQSHPQCTCVPLPKTKSWASILGPLGIDTSDIPDTTIQVQSGADWFDQQDVATQKQVLGSQAAFDLYSSGKATLDDFVGVNRSQQWGNSIYQKSVKQLVGAA